MFECNKCKKTFTTKVNLQYHKKHKACNLSTKIKCDNCDKTFTTQPSMRRHMMKSCKNKDICTDEKQQIYEKLLELQHEIDTLKIKSEKIEMENIKLKNEIKQGNTLSQDRLLGSIYERNTNIVNNASIVAANNNGVIATNNGTINNIILVECGKEDISKIDKTDILNGIKSGFYSTLNLTDTIHFNPKYPEYHNVYISSMKNKYAMMYDGSDWTLVMKDDLIDKLYDEKKNYIEENLDDFLDSLTKSQRKALDRWMDMDEGHAKIKEIKDKIKLLLYNKRNIPLFKTNDNVRISKIKNRM